MVPIKNTFVKTTKIFRPEINLSTAGAAYWSGHNEAAGGSVFSEGTEMADVAMSALLS